ncbi:zinc metalloprotease [Nonomuraea soli]|uniref:Peptidase M43 pregnancy-associated plasma-A domain-containing protein n=1 Tax=Nonomuraea soli TaxID=1032476 RepID=A0A7W0CLG4_9ACTN|nr:zinc metalloprotease [Nonomuraea soli]MBA2893135.1 hypothetical protein [Nonomuraea soli]
MARRATAVTLVCLLAAWPAVAVQAEPGSGCRVAARTSRLPEPYAPTPGQVTDALADLAERMEGAPAPAAKLTVPLWVHVLTDGRRRPPDAAIKEQVATLNAAYGGQYGGPDTGVRFELKGIAVKQQADWFVDPLLHERQMKGELRKGGPETLNLYIAQLSELVLGYSTYPHWYRGAPINDGVVIDWRSLPGGSLRNFDRGYTGVHEIGHWLGLFHTFENGCEAPGDGVDDTPYEATPTEGCPAAKDTCRAPGTDPIHNFMDYAHDRCMQEFTAGQGARMHEMWAAYRSSPEMSDRLP